MNGPTELDRLRLACTQPLPHPGPDELRAAADAVTELSLDEFLKLPQAPLGASASRLTMDHLLREPPPEHGTAFLDVLHELRAKVLPYYLRAHHPRFLAFVPTAPTYVSILGDGLCAALNVFAGVWKEAAGPAAVELLVLDWFKALMGFPASAQGVLTSGGSEANLLALTVARERLDFAERADAVLYASDQRHWSIDRAAKVIGLRPEQVRTLAVGPDYRLRIETLAAAVANDRSAGRRPWAVVASAGATNTGAVDPLGALAGLCVSEGLWLHADAAYGWPAVLTAEGRAELSGLERADSVTLDPHKWLAQTFEAGCLLVRDGALLERTFALRPDYMQDVEPTDGEVNFADRGISLTRRFRALKIWLSLKVLGVAWFRELVTHCRNLATLAQALLARDDAFEILSPRRLSVVCFRCVPPGGSRDAAALDELNRAVCDDLMRTGRAFLSTTRLNGRVALRLCFVNWRTTAADVDEVITTLRNLAARRA